MGIFERNYDYGYRTEGSFRGPRRGYDRGYHRGENRGYGRGGYDRDFGYRGGGGRGGYDRSYNHGLNFDPYYGGREGRSERGWGYGRERGYDAGYHGFDPWEQGRGDTNHRRGMGWLSRGWGFGQDEGDTVF